MAGELIELPFDLTDTFEVVRLWDMVAVKQTGAIEPFSYSQVGKETVAPVVAHFYSVEVFVFILVNMCVV